MMKNILILTAFMASVIVQTTAQTSLSINDALPPYKLSASLLGNGHFAISTKYLGPSKTLIYQEDGTGNRPVNYTSHVHVKIDDVVFQLPFETDTVTQTAPPPNPMKVLNLFRDTVAGRPRINATLEAVMPGTRDTIITIFTMEPVKKPSGAFIRMSTTIQNRGRVARQVGVLQLIDTKIGLNDQAPIATAFGFSGTEQMFDRGVAQGIPEFWLALEGTPIAPGLAARGNLRGDGVIEPSRVLFGNWTDFTAQNVAGLYRVAWKERVATNLSYTDSAILLLWDQKNLAPGARELRSATELGIVDSLTVAYGSGGGGGGGGGGDIAIAGGGSCTALETVDEVPCGDPLYSPYSPDTVQSIYLITNTGKTTTSNLRLVVTGVPLGVRAVTLTSAVIPSALAVGETGVVVVSVAIDPILLSAIRIIPISVLANVSDTLVRTELCVDVPGLLGVIRVDPVATPPVCPGTADTIDVPIQLKGVRCLPIVDVRVLSGPPGVFSIVTPWPTVVPANGRAIVRVRYAPVTQGTDVATIRVAVRDSENVTGQGPRVVDVADTVTVTGTGKNAEFFFASTTDTLDLGTVCVNDTLTGPWNIQNVGGCSITVNAATVSGPDAVRFFIDRTFTTPLSIARAKRTSIPIGFTSATPGVFTAYVIVTSIAEPKVDTLVIRATAQIPAYAPTVGEIVFDTTCPSALASKALVIENPSACPVEIDTILSDAGEFTVSPPGPFVIPAKSRVSIQVRATSAVNGVFTGTLTMRSAVAGDSTRTMRFVVGTRVLDAVPIVDVGDVRVGASGTTTIRLTNSGTLPIDVNGIRVVGLNASEFVATSLTALPTVLAPTQGIDVQVTASPIDVEQRRASLQITSSPTCSVTTIPELRARGIQAVLDIVTATVDAGEQCIGRNVDTTLVIRNLGNTSLEISAINSSDGLVALGGVTPLRVDSGAVVRVPIRIAPSTTGPRASVISFTHDGVWFAKNDTTVNVTTTGLLCVDISLDTMQAMVGERRSIPVYISPSQPTTITSSDVTRLLNETTGTVHFTVSHDASQIRMTNTVNSGGMLLPASTQVVAGMSAVDVTSRGPYRDTTLFCSLEADVLLGPSIRTPLTILVDSLASPYVRVQQHDGLLLSLYCAYDARQVQQSTRPRIWQIDNDNVGVVIPEATVVTIDAFTVDGRLLTIAPSTPVAAGIHQFHVAHDSRGAGLMLLRLQTSAHGVDTAPFLVLPSLRAPVQR